MKPVYTTGDVARICNVANRTVSKWIDSGRIKGYRIPGSNDRRVTHAALQSFLIASGFPATDPDFFQGLAFLLSADEPLCRRLRDHVTAGGFRFLHAPTVFDAGLLLSGEYPLVAVLDFAVGKSWAVTLASRLLHLCPRTVLIALPNEDDPGTVPGFAASYPRPFDPALLEECLSRWLLGGKP